jgi:hypothetical protein
MLTVAKRQSGCGEMTMTHLNSFAGLITLCMLSACGGGGDDGCRINDGQFKLQAPLEPLKLL